MKTILAAAFAALVLGIGAHLAGTAIDHADASRDGWPHRASGPGLAVGHGQMGASTRL